MNLEKFNYNLVESTTNNVLAKARKYYNENLTSQGANDTYGYFTSHPVAPLNKKRLIELMYRLCIESRKINRELKVLDLACGGGLISSCASLVVTEHSHFKPKVLGLDISEPELTLASDFATHTQSGALFSKTNLINDSSWTQQTTKLLGGTPDVVILAYALHHLPMVKEFITRLAEWLPQDTIIFVNEENPISPVFLLKHYLRSFIQRDTACEDHRTYEKWKSILENSDFEVSNLKGFDMLPLINIVSPRLCWSQVFEAKRQNT